MAVLLGGCATKTYGRQGQLTEFEARTLTCREIELEMAKVDGFLQQVNQEARFDARSVASFLGDFGIGNKVERNAAIKSARDRKSALAALRAGKSCDQAATAAAVPAIPDAPPAPPSR